MDRYYVERLRVVNVLCFEIISILLGAIIAGFFSLVWRNQEYQALLPITKSLGFFGVELFESWKIKFCVVLISANVMFLQLLLFNIIGATVGIRKLLSDKELLVWNRILPALIGCGYLGIYIWLFGVGERSVFSLVFLFSLTIVFMYKISYFFCIAQFMYSCMPIGIFCLLFWPYFWSACLWDIGNNISILWKILIALGVCFLIGISSEDSTSGSGGSRSYEDGIIDAFIVASFFS